MANLPGALALMIAALALLGPARAGGASPPEPRALVAGEWTWSGGQSTGRLRIEKVGTDGSFTGRLLDAKGADVGPVTGRVKGSSVVFVWKGPSGKSLDQEWKLDLGSSGGKPSLQGTVREIRSGNSGPVTATKVAAPKGGQASGPPKTPAAGAQPAKAPAPARPSTKPSAPAVAAKPSMATPAATSPSPPAPVPVKRRADGPALSEAETLALPESIRRELAAEKALGADALSGGPPAGPIAIESRSPPSPASSFGDLATLADRNYLAAATMAKESYRTMLGAMDAGRLKRFTAKWAPVLQSPSSQMRKYLNAINPPLAEFQVLRGQIASGVEDFDDRMQEARMASAFGNENAVRSLLSQASVVRQQLLADQARMAAVTRQIQAAGDPPDPIPARARARTRYQDAVKHAKEIVGDKSGGCWVLTKIYSWEMSTD